MDGRALGVDPLRQIVPVASSDAAMALSGAGIENHYVQPVSSAPRDDTVRAGYGSGGKSKTLSNGQQRSFHRSQYALSSMYRSRGRCNIIDSHAGTGRKRIGPRSVSNGASWMQWRPSLCSNQGCSRVAYATSPRVTGSSSRSISSSRKPSYLRNRERIS